MDRNKLNEEWLSLKKQQAEIQVKLQRLDYALRADDELAEVLMNDKLKLDLVPEDAGLNGVVMAAAIDDDVYLIGVEDGWVAKLKLREKTTREKYLEMINNAKKSAE